MWPVYATRHCNFHNTKKLETNSKQKINEIDQKNSEDIEDSEDSENQLWKIGAGFKVKEWSKIDYPVCFVFEKGKLHYSQYVSLKQENLIRCELSSGEVSLKRAMVDNLELDDSSLAEAAKSLKIVISDTDAHSTDVLYHQRCYNKFTRDYKQAVSDREDKGSMETATAENWLLTLIHKW